MPKPTVVTNPAEWMSVAEMAAEVGVSKMSIYRLLHDRVIPHTRIGRVIRVKRRHWRLYVDGYAAMHDDD